MICLYYPTPMKNRTIIPYPAFYVKAFLSFIFFSGFLLPAVLFGQMGRDGSETVSASGVIFNRYDLLASTASAGATSVTVNNVANLSASAISGSANNPYATNLLGYGDLIMIIKMQGASITSGNVANAAVNNNPPQTDVYGKITAYNGVGSYELCMVQAVSGNNIILCYALSNSYVVSGAQRVQVVRVPRLSSLTINNGASITGLAWSNSYTGGIIALEVSGSATINGTINATGLGFRGGAVLTTPKPLGGQFNQYDFVTNDLNYGAEKGEGIAGSQTDYDTYYGGRYKRGAPANGGGGGNANCAGGGGGANAGISPTDTSNYNGWGVPDATPSGWSSAWNLETSITGLSATSTSSGGGRGGYCYSKQPRDPLTVAPGGNWQGDKRHIGGGWGGRPLLYTSNNVLFMGGGGGAADADDQAGGSGGNGGGIVFITVTSNLSGTGSIIADGNNGENTTNRTNPFNATSTGRDGAGGAGGGGAIKLNVQGSITGVSLSAKGGNGGNQLITAVQNSETEGPGGGGGGGYIGVTGFPSISMNTSGGLYGTTDCTQMSTFTANGATGGRGGGSVAGLTFIGSPDVPMPVKLECFDMTQVSNKKVQISWTVYNETEMCCYELQQKTAGSEWSKVTSQLAQSGNNVEKRYALTINIPLEQTVYRIKAISKYGTSSYTCVKTLKPLNTPEITVTVSGERLYVNHLNTACTFKLYNNSGQEIKLNINRAANFSIIDKAGLANGLYYLQIITANDQIVYRFVK